MSDPLFRFRDICSYIKEPSIREMLELWLIKNVQTFQVEARVDREGGTEALRHYQEATLKQLVEGAVKNCELIETKEWLQGDHKFGTIITRKIHVIGAKP